MKAKSLNELIQDKRCIRCKNKFNSPSYDARGFPRFTVCQKCVNKEDNLKIKKSFKKDLKTF